MNVLLLALLCWQPTIDQQRIELDAIIDPPYWLGCASPDEGLDITAIQDGIQLFTYTGGCEWELAYIVKAEPILFYDGGEYVGRITPEPASILLFLFGLLAKKGCGNE